MWPNSQFSVDLVTFTEEILNGNLHFCTVFPSVSVKSVSANGYMDILFYTTLDI